MRERTTILFLLNSLGLGGSETKVVKLANTFAEAGSPVAVAYLNRPDTLSGALRDDVDLMHLRRKGRYSIGALWRLGRRIRKRNVVVVAVYLYPLLYALPAVKTFAGKESRIACLINTTDLLDRERTHGHVFAPFIRRCDNVVFGCDAQLRLWTARYDLPADRSICIYNGVDESEFAPNFDPAATLEVRNSLEIPRESFVIGGVGRLAEEKNFSLLIRAVADLISNGLDVHLLLVGDGPETQQLRQLAAALGISEQIRFAGARKDVRPYLSNMDVFVLPSRAVETFSNAALEAMALSIPVIQSNIGGAAEMIDDGVSGLLFPSEDLDRLVRLLRNLVESEERRSSIGRAARKRVIDRFTSSQMIESYRRLLVGRETDCA